jgi:predicted transcriptional regulator
LGIGGIKVLMNRLTNTSVDSRNSNAVRLFCDTQTALKRLKAYEDAGLSPEEVNKFVKEANKIKNECIKVCQMGADMKLIKREYKAGHKPYSDDIRRYKYQLANCPKICPNYKEAEE